MKSSLNTQRPPSPIYVTHALYTLIICIRRPSTWINYFGKHWQQYHLKHKNVKMGPRLFACCSPLRWHHIYLYICVRILDNSMDGINFFFLSVDSPGWQNCGGLALKSSMAVVVTTVFVCITAWAPSHAAICLSHSRYIIIMSTQPFFGGWEKS